MSHLILTIEEINRVSEMIEGIYRKVDDPAFREAFLRGLRRLIDYDFADFYLGIANIDGVPKLVDPITFGSYGKRFADNFMHEYDIKYYKMDYVNWIYLNPESTVYRESDLLNHDVRTRSPFYREYLQKFDLTLLSGISLSSGGQFLGAITLYRTSGKADFSDKDLYIMRLLAPHIESKLKSEQVRTVSRHKIDSHMLKYRYRLTKREIEIAGYLLYGYSNGEIADVLGISHNTVKKHVYNLYGKLHISNRPHLVKFIITQNLIGVWDPAIY